MTKDLPQPPARPPAFSFRDAAVSPLPLPGLGHSLNQAARQQEGQQFCVSSGFHAQLAGESGVAVAASSYEQHAWRGSGNPVALSLELGLRASARWRVISPAQKMPSIGILELCSGSGAVYKCGLETRSRWGLGSVIQALQRILTCKALSLAHHDTLTGQHCTLKELHLPLPVPAVLGEARGDVPEVCSTMYTPMLQV